MKIFGQSFFAKKPGGASTSRGLRRTLGVPGYDEGVVGLPDLEFMSELEPPSGLDKFRRMERNDPIIGGLMLRLKGIFSRVTWNVTGENADFIQAQMNALPKGFGNLMELLASSLTYGFALGEEIFALESGRVLLKDIEPRFQTSITSMPPGEAIQQVGGAYIKIPLTKCLHHVFMDENRSPYGVSILRHVYKSYYYKINCEAAEATGIDRDLSGLPILSAPEGFDFAATDSSSPSYDANVAATLDWAIDLVGNVRKDSQQGVVKPFGWTFDLVRGTGTASINPTETIQRYNSEIASGLLEGFAVTGSTQNKGNVEILVGDFIAACGGFVNSMEESLQKQVVDRICLFNGLTPPKIALKPPRLTDLAKLASFVARLVAQEVVKPSPALERELLSIAELPYEENENAST